MIPMGHISQRISRFLGLVAARIAARYYAITKVLQRAMTSCVDNKVVARWTNN